MKGASKEQAVLGAAVLVGIGVLCYRYAIWSEKRKQAGIELWLKAEIDGLEEERKEKGL